MQQDTGNLRVTSGHGCRLHWLLLLLLSLSPPAPQAAGKKGKMAAHDNGGSSQQ
jgi:hypothetical protein